MERQIDRALMSDSAGTTTEGENEATDLEQKWLKLCSIALATVSAATSTWMHLSIAALTLHTSKVGMNATERDNSRAAIIYNISEAEYVKQSTGEAIQDAILNSPRFYPFFKDCLCSIDGTHVRVKVSQVDAPRYRGRKDWPTQNVLAACTLDLKFTYVLAGWEGSASDSRVFHSALNREEPLQIPEGKFYLGDAGFGLSSGLLTPYGRTRYHLKEYSQRGPETPEELFNHHHSSLKNSIERAFGILKKRFPIISSGAECQYSCATVTHIILTCCVLHNFLLTVDGDGTNVANEEISNDGDDIDDLSASAGRAQLNEHPGFEYSRGAAIRDRIASQMWEAYISNTTK